MENRSKASGRFLLPHVEYFITDQACFKAVYYPPKHQYSITTGGKVFTRNMLNSCHILYSTFSIIRICIFGILVITFVTHTQIIFKNSYLKIQFLYMSFSKFRVPDSVFLVQSLGIFS